MHAPEQVTAQFASLYPQPRYIPSYATYNGMGAAADSLFGNMTTALKDKGIWGSTLVVMTSGEGFRQSPFKSLRVRQSHTTDSPHASFQIMVALWQNKQAVATRTTIH